MLERMTDDDVAFRASTQDGSYPRPQLVRPHWADLTGTWGFAFDDEDAGARLGWEGTGIRSGRIVVPFPPESAASGVGSKRWTSRSL